MKDQARRILIVDPDRLFAGKLSALLSSRGYDVESAEGITQAVKRLKDVNFGCVILDEDLPEMKGHDAVPVLKAISCEVPIIMTAARNSLELESSIRRQDVFFYHAKSFDINELQMAVRDALRKIGKPDRPRPPDRPARILIVDGDRDFVAEMATVLKDNFYEVSAAYSKNEAMEMVQSIEPDLVLLDITMDGLSDGLTIWKKLKYDRELRHIPVLVVSAIGRKTGFGFPAEVGAEDFGADDYLEKPVSAADLLQRVERLLG